MEPFSAKSSTSKPLFPKGPALGLPALILCLVSAGFILADSRSTALVPLRHFVSITLTPVVWLAELPSNIANLGGYLSGRGTLLSENTELRESLLRQEARLRRLDALEAENRRLRELLSSSSQLEEHVLVAEILSISQDPYRHQIMINKGARDGVYRGQAIVDAYGVLGQIVTVNPHRAIAMLITDPDHSIPVEVNRTGLQTVARGRGEGGGLALPFLPGNADVRVGDLLVSSALGGRFPEGYPVGEVAEVRYQPGEHFMEAIAYPAARILRGRQVLLVWSESYLVEEGSNPSAVPDPAAAPPAGQQP